MNRLTSEYEIVKKKMKFKMPYGKSVLEIQTKCASGTCDLHILRAKDVADAALGARELLTMPGPLATHPHLDRLPETPPQNDAWVICYLGVGANDSAEFEITAVSVSGDAVKVEYSKSKQDPKATKTPYVFLIPLGKRPIRPELLELVEVRNGKEKVKVYSRLDWPMHSAEVKKLGDNSKELKTIFTTSGQDGFRPGWNTSNLKKKFLMCGADTFLVSCENDQNPLAGTERILIQGGSPDECDSRTLKKPNFWLATYLGFGGPWDLKKVERDGKVIRFSFSEHDRNSTRIAAYHYYWTDLGQLDPDIYELQLCDLDRNQIVLTRHVIVR
jgi:hypothetical protein